MNRHDLPPGCLSGELPCRICQLCLDHAHWQQQNEWEIDEAELAWLQGQAGHEAQDQTHDEILEEMMKEM